MVVFFSTSLVIMPPRVFNAQRKGRHVQQQHVANLARQHAPWMAAPTATTSSGFTPLCGSLPNISRTRSWTLGIRVDPPTSHHFVDFAPVRNFASAIA